MAQASRGAAVFMWRLRAATHVRHPCPEESHLEPRTGAREQGFGPPGLEEARLETTGLAEQAVEVDPADPAEQARPEDDVAASPRHDPRRRRRSHRAPIG